MLSVIFSRVAILIFLGYMHAAAGIMQKRFRANGITLANSQPDVTLAKLCDHVAAANGAETVNWHED